MNDTRIYKLATALAVFLCFAPSVFSAGWEDTNPEDHSAFYVGDLPKIKVIIEKKGYLKPDTDLQEVAFCMALETGKIDVAKYLVSKGWKVRSDRQKIGPLHCAARSGNVELAQLLVDQGADVQFADETKETVIHTAAKAGRLEMIQFLQTKAVDINAKNYEGKTALDLALAWQPDNKALIAYLKKVTKTR